MKLSQKATKELLHRNLFRKDMAAALLAIINHVWAANETLQQTFGPVMDADDERTRHAPIPYVEFWLIASPPFITTASRQIYRCTFDTVLRSDKMPEGVEKDLDQIVSCVESLNSLSGNRLLPFDDCHVVSVSTLHAACSYRKESLAARRPGKYAVTGHATFRLVLELTREEMGVANGDS